MDRQALEKRFTNHHVGFRLAEDMDSIRLSAYAFALDIDSIQPDGVEKEQAILRLEEVVFWANAGIARNTVDRDAMIDDQS